MKHNKYKTPPTWSDRLLNWLVAPHLREEVLGDLHERYYRRAQRLGERNARRWYWREVLAYVRPRFIKRQPSICLSPFFLNPDMLRNYFKIATRSLLKNRGYASIHITGLSIGLWACMMVASVVLNDLSYDQQWSRKNDIYRIVSVNKMGEGLYDRFPSSFAGLAPHLKKDYPEVESYSELYTGDLHLNLGANNHNSEVKTQVLHADTTIWHILDINVIAGIPQQFKHGNRNLVISKSFRNKYFPNDNPVGKIIHDIPSYGEQASPFLITGVMDDLPVNSHLRADVLFLHKGRTEDLNSKEFGTFSQNYILLKPGTDIARFANKVNQWYTRFAGSKVKYQFEFQSLKDIHLHSDFDKKNKTYGSAQNMYIFSGIALLLLFIACINFVNLSTAKAITRLKETGVRKILSASRTQLIIQFLAEALLVFGIAATLAVCLYLVSLKSVEISLGQQLVKTVLSDWPGIGSALGVVLITCLLTGFYPAWLISGLKPANTLKGMLLPSSTFGAHQFRKGLVVSQFCISIFVLLALIVVQRQLDFIQSRDMGFNRNNLLSIDYVSWDGKSDAFKKELTKIPGIVNASVSQWVPTQGAGFMSKDVEDPADASTKVKVWYISGDLDLAQTLQLRLAKGRLFDKKFSTDALNADSLQSVDWEKYEGVTKLQPSLITASAAKILHVGKLGNQIKNANTLPVGIVENFNNESLHEPIKPTIILANKSAQYGGMLLRVVPGSERTVNTALRKLWKQFFPNKLLNVNRVDDLLNKQYEAEDKLRQFFTFFSGLTMFLSALGIFGLVVQAAEQRAKEIGIRKVLGASVAGIVQLLSKDFVKLVLIAIVIASPIAWYATNRWLQGFAYKIDIEWWMFALAGLLAVTIALLTVSFQSVKAALMNPVKSLRSE